MSEPEPDGAPSYEVEDFAYRMWRHLGHDTNALPEYFVSAMQIAAIDHMRSWALGTPEGDWVSMAVPSDGSYGVPEGLVSGFPCTCSGGDYQIVQGLELDEFSQARLDASVAELVGERDAVRELGLV